MSIDLICLCFQNMLYMKKLIMLSASILVAGALLFTSCIKAKDWNCQCTINDNGSVSTVDVPIPGLTKVDAGRSCDLTESNYNANASAGISISCELKEK